MEAILNGHAHSRAQTALANSPIFELRHLRVDHRETSLFLSGTVSSFYYKQLAQEVVRSVSNGCRVVNDVSVCESRAR